ncbi:Hint domain-containing protein [Shimia sp.]|uniref:Hint domain-containing protein n=1 Tax=Shimia sp. TaxID=1954381 RepID=UPI00329A4869
MADPTGPGIVDGTLNDDDMDVGFSDAGVGGDVITEGDDIISSSDGNDSVQAGGGDDTVFGGMGDDTLRGGSDDDLIISDTLGPYNGTGEAGDDLVAGEGGNDTVFASAGNDTIYGDYEPGTEPAPIGGGRESFNWSDLGSPSDGDPLDGPMTQNTGSVEVTYTTGGNHGVDSTFETDPQLVTGINGGSETVNPNSSLDSDLDPREAAIYNLEFSDPVEDVQFRVSDIDNTSAVKVLAYDAEGNSIEVNLTATDTTSLQITDVDGVPGKEAAISFGGDGESDDPDNSVLYDIPGPVARIEIVHLNIGDEVSDVNVSDIFFTSPNTAVDEDADDLLIGGEGDDVIYGQQGDDTIIGMTGNDYMSGGDDQDVFVYFGPGDTIDGNEGGVDFDSIYMLDVAERVNPGGDLRVDYDPANSENGTITFLDAEGNETGVTTFYNIENIADESSGPPTIICFTPGTRILTPMGEVPVENLRAGDKVVTRDNGLQDICWSGKKHLSGKDLMARPQLRPILIKQGALGPNQPERDMMVSPSHRMLLVSQQAELLFDEREVLVAAKHLTHLDGVLQVDTVGVDYIHIMCENHEVLLADGAWSESFQPGEYSINGIDNDQRSEIFDLFPALREREGLEAYTAARHTLKRHEAQLIG